MTNDQSPQKPSARQWVILAIVVVVVSLVVGVPLGVVVALNTWLEFTVWAVPLVVGVVTLAIGTTVLTRDAMGRLPLKSANATAVGSHEGLARTGPECRWTEVWR
jgi:hypothetical protein